MRNRLVNEKGNVYNYNGEQTDRTTLQHYNNCNKRRKIKRKNDLEREILDL